MGLPWESRCVFASFLLLIVFAGLIDSHGGHDHHDHHHDHHDGDARDNVRFRYSREANEAPLHDRGHHHAHDAHHHKERTRESGGGGLPKGTADGPSRNLLLSQAIGATVLISAAPFLILFFIPLDRTESSQPLLKVLLSFAAGGLLGDAFLHLIPHAIMQQQGGGHGHDHGSHSHVHAHSHDESEHGHTHDLTVGMWVLAGIVAFLLVEKFVRIVKGGHHHHHDHAHDDVSDNKHADDASAAESIEDESSGKDEKDDESASKTRDKAGSSSEVDAIVRQRKAVPKEVSPVVSSRSVAEKSEAGILPRDIKVAAYLNLAADFTHNFTDGLAIGASFLRGNAIGYLTTLSILLHEIPHEIGDFAILIQSGCGKRKAIMLQLVTAIGALSGTVTSFVAEGYGEKATAWILPFTAGGFIYIATVSVLPELLEGVTNLKQSIMEVLALLVGVYMMVLIAEYE